MSAQIEFAAVGRKCRVPRAMARELAARVRGFPRLHVQHGRGACRKGDDPTMMRTSFCSSDVARRRRSGVSLLVVLVSLCLVAIVAVLAIPRYFGRHEVTLDNACRLLTRDLRSLQNRAALEKIPARLVFDADGWQALDPSDQPIEGLGEGHAIVRRFSSDGVFEGVTLRTIEVGADSALKVDARGLVGAAGRLVFEFRGETREVAIARGSGQVLVHGAELSEP